jgi:hypothetical protein
MKSSTTATADGPRDPVRPAAADAELATTGLRGYPLIVEAVIQHKVR